MLNNKNHPVTNFVTYGLLTLNKPTPKDNLTMYGMIDICNMTTFTINPQLT